MDKSDEEWEDLGFSPEPDESRGNHPQVVTFDDTFEDEPQPAQDVEGSSERPPKPLVFELRAKHPLKVTESSEDNGQVTAHEIIEEGLACALVEETLPSGFSSDSDDTEAEENHESDAEGCGDDSIRPNEDEESYRWRESDADTLDPPLDETAAFEGPLENDTTSAQEDEIVHSQLMIQHSPVVTHLQPTGTSAESHPRYFSRMDLSIVLIALLVYLGVHGLNTSEPFVQGPQHHLQSMPMADFQMEHSLLRSWNRELKACRNHACCFSMFVLAGDAPSHQLAVREFIRQSGKNATTSIVSWTADQLAEALEDPDARLPTLIEDSNGDMQPIRVFVVDKADRLKARQVRQIYKFGASRCSSRKSKPRRDKTKKKKRSDNPTDSFHMVVVLSTSLGKDLLLQPEDIVTDKYIEEARFIRRDWFALPELVMNQRHILHGVKGFQPREVFEQFYLSKTIRQEQHQGLLQRIKDWWSSRRSQQPCARPRDPAMQFAGTGHGDWFESKKRSLVITDRGWKVLKRQLSTMKNVTEWLGKQYLVWTRQDQCKAVLHKQLGSDKIASFPVFCSTSAPVM